MPHRTTPAALTAPEIVGQAWAVGLTASVAATTIYTAPVRGTYRVNVYHECTTAVAARLFDTTIGWTDAVGARTRIGAPQLNLATTAEESGVLVIEAKEGTAITYAATFNAGAGAPVCNQRITVERLT